MRANPTESLDTIDSARHPQVEKHSVHFARKSCQPLAPGGSRSGCVAKVGQRLGKTLAQRRVVVNDQDGRHGTSISKVAPPPVVTRRTSPP